MFFGRDDEVQNLIDILRSDFAVSRLIAVYGESGVGKSSLVRAGVLPRLQRSERDWVVLEPVEAGAHAVQFLRNAFKTLGVPVPDDTDPQALCGALQAWRLAKATKLHPLLISIDQFEQCFLTPAHPLLAQLQALLALEKVRVLVTIRAAFLPRLLDFPGHRTWLLSPLTSTSLAKVIREPARLVSLQLEDGLVNQIIHDAGTQTPLPLVAALLERLYKRFSQDRIIKLVEYLQLGSTDQTPFEALIANRAAEATRDASSAEINALREFIVTELVQFEPSRGVFLKRKGQRAGADSSIQTLLDQLVEQRLLVEEGAGIAVAHEALFDAWKNLSEWLNAERPYLQERHRIEDAYATWLRATDSQKPEALLSGLLLTQAEQRLLSSPKRFTSELRGFIELSALRRQQTIAELRAAKTQSEELNKQAAERALGRARETLDAGEQSSYLAYLVESAGYMSAVSTQQAALALQQQSSPALRSVLAHQGGLILPPLARMVCA